MYGTLLFIDTIHYPLTGPTEAIYLGLVLILHGEYTKEIDCISYNMWNFQPDFFLKASPTDYLQSRLAVLVLTTVLFIEIFSLNFVST